MHADGRALLENHLPIVLDCLLEAGAVRLNLIEQLAQILPDGPGGSRYQPFETITTCVRPVMEFAFVAAARSTPGVEIRNGAWSRNY